MRRGELWPRVILAVAAGLAFWYVAALAPWVRWSLLRWALPSLAPSSWPGLAAAATRAAVFLLGVAAVMAVGVVPGRVLAGFLRLPDRGLCRIIPSGWLLASFVVLGIGLTGLWTVEVFGALAAVPLATGAVHLARVRRSLALPPALRKPVFIVPAVVLGWVALLIVLAPEVFQDAMRYHLFFPRRFFLEHKFIYVERYFFWSYMGLPHMLYGPALAVPGEWLAKAVNVAFLLLSLAALWRISGVAGLPDWGRRLLLALTVSAPGLMLITGSVFVEHCAALYVLLAVEAALDAELGRGRLRSAAVMMGAAFSAKYTAVFGMAGLALMVLSATSGHPWARLARSSLARAAAWFAVPLLPWAAVRWLQTGDPVSPVLGRYGLPTMDLASGPALRKYYEFTYQAYEKWLADPGSLLTYLVSFPVNFSGGHPGYWEHPGPAIAALALAGVVYYSAAALPIRRLLLCCAGGIITWIVLFGGVSPHYVIALCGLWLAGLVGVLPGIPDPAGRWLRSGLTALVVFQTLVSAVGGVYGFGPRDVALGLMSRETYLARGLAPGGVHYAARRELEAAAPDRGAVYVYGDDTSYYLGGVVHVDYEHGSDPWIWRMAAACDAPRRLRIRLRQRGFTHMLYSTRWPQDLSAAGDYGFRHDRRTHRLFQEFWRTYADPLVQCRGRSHGTDRFTGAFAFRRRPSEAAREAVPAPARPMLPGAEELVLPGDRLRRGGEAAAAERAYREAAERFPDSADLADRLALMARRRGDRAAAARHDRRLERLGWRPFRESAGGP